MPKKHAPRHGSMQYWPRRKASDIVARIRSWQGKEAKALGFPGYKVGMTHVMATDNRPNSLSKNEAIQVPVTVIECPPIKVAGIVLYNEDEYGQHCAGTIMAPSLDKNLSRTIPIPKNIKKKVEDYKDVSDVRLLVHTQPHLIGLKKKPEVFEMGIGGKPNEQLAYAKEMLGKEIKISDIFGEGNQIDVHSVTKGKGYQGPVKRFGIAIRHHKSEKTKRGPGSLGSWGAPTTHRAPHAGQTGFHLRTELNKWIIKIGKEGINPKGGFKRYGEVTNEYMLVKGSIGGASKRLITFTPARRPDPKTPKEAPTLEYVSQASKQ